MLAYSPVKAQDCAGKVGVHTFMTLVLRGIFLVRRWLANNHSFRKKKIILVSRSHCWLCNMFIVNNIVNERYLSEQVSLIVYPSKNNLFSVISHSYLSHHSKYIRCGRYICLKPAVVCMLSHCIPYVILYILLY